MARDDRRASRVMQTRCRGTFQVFVSLVAISTYDDNLQKLLCVYAFPECHMDTLLPLCYEECVAVRQLFCYKEWALIEDNKSRGIYFTSRGHFELPDCEKLPKYKIENNIATCSYAGLIDINSAEVTCKYLRNMLFFKWCRVKDLVFPLACKTFPFSPILLH